MSRQKIVLWLIYTNNRYNPRIAWQNQHYRSVFFYDVVGNYGDGGRLEGLYPARMFNADGIYTLNAGPVNVDHARYHVFAYRRGEDSIRMYTGSFPNHFAPDDDNHMGGKVVLCLRPGHPLNDDVDEDIEEFSKLNQEVERVLRELNQLAESGRAPSPSTVERIVYVGPSRLPRERIPSDSRPTHPYTVQLDHGEIEVNPNDPYFDSSAGETGQWIDPTAPPYEFPSNG